MVGGLSCDTSSRFVAAVKSYWEPLSTFTGAGMDEFYERTELILELTIGKARLPSKWKGNPGKVVGRWGQPEPDVKEGSVWQTRDRVDCHHFAHQCLPHCPLLKLRKFVFLLFKEEIRWWWFRKTLVIFTHFFYLHPTFNFCRVWLIYSPRISDSIRYILAYISDSLDVSWRGEVVDHVETALHTEPRHVEMSVQPAIMG